METAFASLPEPVLSIIASRVASNSPQQWCKVSSTCKRLWNADFAYLECREGVPLEGERPLRDA